MPEWIRRLRYLLNRRRIEEDLAREMELHREMAALQGRSHFGNALYLREEAREAWGWMWVDRLGQDVRYAGRMLLRAPWFTLAAVLMLAIGIGVNVAVFGFFDLMVLRPLNVRDPATLLRFHRRAPEGYAFALPYPEMAFFRENSKTLSAVLALNTTRVAVEGEEKSVEAHFVTPDFFSELGAAAERGRLLAAALDQDPGAAPVVVLSHGFWQRHFGGDPRTIGAKMEINGKPATIVGIAPADFNGLSMNVPALWAPLNQQPYFASGSRLLTDFAGTGGVQMWGRLAPGMNPRAAEEELRSLAAQLRRQYPSGIWKNETLPSEPGGFATSVMIGNRSGTGTEERNQLFPIFVLVGALVLLILGVACANLGSLLLARGVAREREISIRLAVGAGSGRVVRQLFTESLLLGLLGSVAGLGLGYVVLRGLMAISGAPAWMNPAPDWRIALFAAGAGFAAAVVFGLVPALQIARRRHRATVTRQFLIGTQVAASCVLLIVSGLLGRALDHAVSADPGFDYKQVISIDPGLERHGYSPARARAYLDALTARLQALPGVQSVSLALSPPLGRVSITTGIAYEGRNLNVQINHVDPEFLRTMKIPLVRGRNLLRGEPRAVVVSESMARAFAGGEPLGKTFNLGADMTVVGVAGSARQVKLEDSDSVEVYLPIEAEDFPRLFVLVRTAGRPEDLAPSAAAAARALDPDLFPEVDLLKAGFRRKLEGAQYFALSVTALGGIAHLLACLGIVGVVAYAVSQRTKEIGIRMALGAKPAHVLRVVLRRLAVPVTAGLVAGVAAAAALSQLLRQELFGISNLDPATYAVAVAVFVITVAVSALLPARRALRVDPLRALRYE